MSQKLLSATKQDDFQSARQHKRDDFGLNLFAELRHDFEIEDDVN